METIYRIFTVLSTMLILLSVQSFSTEGNAAGSAGTEIKIKDNTFTSASAETMFLSYSIETCYANIALASIAEKKASSPYLKDIATTLEHEHLNWLKELKILAKNNNQSTPSGMASGDKVLLKHLNKQPAQEFDQQWISLLIDKHQEFIDVYEGYEQKTPINKTTKNWIKENTPHFHSHLDRLIMFEESLRFAE